jgi:hypothetical protein
MKVKMRTNNFNKYSFLRKLLASPPGKKGFWGIRYIFNGHQGKTRKVRSFFIELSVVSIRRQPKRNVPSEENSFDLLKTIDPNAALHETAASIPQNTDKYVLVRAGINGKDGRTFEARFPFSEVSIREDRICIRDGQIEFGESGIWGEIQNRISWKLRLRNTQGADSLVKTRRLRWSAVSKALQFSGTLRIDREEYPVLPDTSCGFMDRMSGSDLPEPWFFLSCANLMSNISARRLGGSFFIVHGVFANKIAVMAVIEGVRHDFNLTRFFPPWRQTFNCAKTGDIIHWSASIQSRSLVIDIDVSCKITDMKLTVYDMPQGEEKTLELLRGVTGKAEIRLYKKAGKNLELMEHARSSQALCEYGEAEWDFV